MELKNGRTQIEYIWNGELLGDFPSWALKTAWKEQGNEVLNWLIDYMDNKCLNIKSFEKKATKYLTYQLNPIRNLLNILQEIEIYDHSALNKNEK